jgi:Ala-tRNA(Pro) deacylase
MPLQKLREFLDQNSVKYVSVSHSPAYTAQEIAASAHIPGQELAKTVMVKLDGEMAMAVLPASFKVDLEQLRSAAGATEVALATEDEFRGLFPGCEPGAMPPFGNLWNMSVFACETLAEDDEIAFNAGSHTELVKLAFADFARLVNPKVTRFSATES